jgi:Ni2+-binding GTPase involved in maturation of urease and hydrogenase
VSAKTRMIEVRQNVLKQNDVVARALRQRFREAGVFVVSMVSSPGAGKTALLEKMLTLLQPEFRVAALVDYHRDRLSPRGGDGPRRARRLETRPAGFFIH